MFLEFFGPNHGHKEVDEEQQGDNRDDNCFHGVPLKPVAEAHVKSAHDEKQHDDSNEEEVAHCSDPDAMNRIINSLNLQRFLPLALIKRGAGDVKRSLKPAISHPCLTSRKSLPRPETTMESQPQARWLTLS
jgi:hypothetical protein